MDARSVGTRPEAERGMVVIAVLLVAILLGSLAMAAVEEGLGDRTAVKHQVSNTLALEICEVGLVRSEIEIATNTDRDGGGIGNVAGEVNGGAYSVVAEKVPNVVGRWVLVGRGEYEHSVRRVEVGLKVNGGVFSYAMFGKDSVELEGGGQTDSFDSRLGSYASQAVNGAGSFDGLYAEANGLVGSNLNVRLWARTVVRGDAYPGPTGTYSGSREKVWGDLSNLPEPVDLPPPELDEFIDAMANNDNDQIDGSMKGVTYDPALFKLRLGAGADLVLSGGTYFFTEVTTVGNGSMTVTKPSTVYVTGTLDFGGGAIANTGGKASDLIIYAHPYDIVPGYDPLGAGDIEMSGGTNAAFALYAPYKDIAAGGGNDVFGAVVGRNIHLQGGSLFHYDEALAEWGYGDGKLGTRLYWVELGTHND